VGFNSFPAYLPLLIMDTRGLLKQRGYELKLVPFAFEGQNNFAQPELYDKLRQGEWDILATTLDSFALYADARAGAITTLIDESAGADKIVARPEIGTVNDLKGKRIAVLDGGIGEFFLYYALSIAGLTPGDVTIVRKPNIGDAVQAYIAGEADAVSAWEPDILAAEEKGGKVLVSSADLRVIVDVMITSRPALENKGPAVQAFHEAWYQALQLLIDAPEEAGQAVIDWGHPDWTYVSAPTDPQEQLKTIAQATLGANELAFRSPDLLVSRVKEMQQLWSQVGKQPPQVDDATQLVDGQFVAQAAKASQLFSKRPPSNSSFLLTSRIELPALAQQDQANLQSVIRLPLDACDFVSDTVRLTQKCINDLTTQVLPVLRTSNLYLQIQGGAAWPGPAGRYTEQDIQQFARERAYIFASFLAQQGLDTNRFLIGDPLPAQCRDCLDETLMAKDRVVRFTLVAGGR
jgi:ABC-type nitrate/sulfonate/bicarbonate transport system substrate-binding protein